MDLENGFKKGFDSLRNLQIVKRYGQKIIKNYNNDTE